MKIAVIAANGRLGKRFVEAALSSGHTVNAGVRGESNLSSHPQLKVTSCDATNTEDLSKLFENQEVVVSAIGHVKGSAPNVQTLATEAIIAAMDKQGLKRYVDVTGTGVRFPGDKIGIVDRFLNMGVEVIDKYRVKDGRDHQEVLKKSNLDWTTIRVLKLQNVAMKPFELTLNGPTKWYVGREEVAKAMLQVVEDNSFVKQSPIISSSSKV